MRTLAWIRERPRSAMSTTVFSVSAAAIAVLALSSPGFPPQNVDANDGGVWVTNQSAQQYARFIRQIGEIDEGQPSASQRFDILQVAGQVVAHDQENGLLLIVDPTGGSTPVQVPLPSDTDQVVLNGPEGSATLAVRTGSGQVWVAPASQAAALKVGSEDPSDDTPPSYEAGEGAVLAVDVEGRVHVVSPERGVVASWLPGQEVDEEPLPEGWGTGLGRQDESTLQVAAIGDRLVALDVARGQMLLPSGVKTVAQDTSAQLQQSSAASDVVLVATADGLRAFPLDGGDAQVILDGLSADSAVAPVRVGGCVHGAFVTGTTGERVRACDAQEPERDVLSWQGKPAVIKGPLVFRANRGSVALNEVDTGGVFDVAADDPERVDWRQRRTDTTKTVESLTSSTDPDACRSEGPNSAPKAVDDPKPGQRIGARQGQPVVVAVLANDSDPDCDVLAVTGWEPIPESTGLLSLVGDGRLLQFQSDPDFTGQVAITYRISDGHNDEVSARVTINVIGRDDSNDAPVQDKVTTLSVGKGKSVTYNVLPDFRDPNGDPLRLESVDAGGSGTVRFTPDGQVTYTDGGQTEGSVPVGLTVSDGRDDAQGKLTIQVVGTDAPPVARDDYARAVVGRPVELLPLSNDADPNGNALKLGAPQVVQGPDGATLDIRTDAAAGRVTVTAPKPGTYQLTYTVTAGVRSAVGRIRVDVAAADENRPPAAMVDVASVRPSSTTTVDLLANDVDPDGDVIAVTTHSLNDALDLQLDRQRYLKITPLKRVSTSILITYTLTDGLDGHDVVGTVVVRPDDGGSSGQPPIAVRDVARVRAGGVVSIPVLANDLSPDNSRIQLEPDLATKPGKGEALVSGTTIRYRAGAATGVDRFSYEVGDANDRRSTGLVTVTISAPDQNSAPVPPVVEARVFQGKSVDVELPLAGTDPDGDLVVLESVGGIGTVLRNPWEALPGTSTIRYTASSPDPGTDLVAYTVCDVVAQRECVEGVLKVGVFRSPATNRSPSTALDEIVVRPGSRVAIPVLDNDSDPDGDALEFAEPGLGAVPAGVSAEIDGRAVVVTAPAATGGYRVTYRVRDGRDRPAVPGYIALTVSPYARNQPPIARDDRAVISEPGQTTVDVDVLANDSDPDGTADDLTISVPSGQDAEPAGRQVRVTLTDSPRVVAYAIADGEDGTAMGFIAVPSIKSNLAPGPANKRFEVPAGETLTLRVDEFAIDPDGDPLVIDNAKGAVASPPSAVALVAEGGAAVTYQPPRETLANEATLSIPVRATAGDTSVVSIPVRVTITSGQNRAPQTTQLEFEVEQASTESVVASLLGAVSDPDKEDVGQPFTFSEARGPDGGVTAQLASDGQVSLDADERTKVGDSATFTYTVTDARGAAATGTFRVVVVKTSQEPPRALADQLPRLDQGETVTVPVLSNDVDPFEGTDRSGQNKIVDVAPTGGVAAAATSEGGAITVTGGTTPGLALVRYTYADAVGREAEGVLTVTVWGPPSQVASAPKVESLTSDTVTLSWPPSSANAKVEDSKARALWYIVKYTSVGGRAGEQRCDASTCTIVDLKPGAAYDFTVVAENVVGPADASPALRGVIPDQLPEWGQAAGPQFKVTGFEDGELSLAWAAPQYAGTPLTGYQFSVTPEAGVSVPTLDGRTTSTTVTRLKNGVEYTFTLCPVNRVGVNVDECTQTSGTSYGPPSGLAKPSIQLIPDAVTSRVTASWPLPTEVGGDAGALSFEVTLLRGGAPVAGWPKDNGRSRAIDVAVDNDAADYSIRVAAHNPWTELPGNSAPSATSAEVTALAPPSAVQSLAAAGTGTDRQLRLSFRPPANFGGLAGSSLAYWYSVGAEPARQMSTSGSSTLTALIVVPSNGSNTVTVWAQNTQPGTKATVTADAYGPPRPPRITSSTKISSVAYEICWDANGTENGQPVPGVEFRTFDGSVLQSGWQAAGLTGCRQITGSRGQTVRLEVQSVDTQGTKSAVAVGTGLVHDMYVVLEKGPQYNGASYYVIVKIYYGRWNSLYGCELSSSDGDLNGKWQRNVDTDGSGYGDNFSNIPTGTAWVWNGGGTAYVNCEGKTASISW